MEDSSKTSIEALFRCPSICDSDIETKWAEWNVDRMPLQMFITWIRIFNFRQWHGCGHIIRGGLSNAWSMFAETEPKSAAWIIDNTKLLVKMELCESYKEKNGPSNRIFTSKG